MAGKRTGNRPWKHQYGLDRKYTARVDRAVARGEYTPTKLEREAGVDRVKSARKAARHAHLVQGANELLYAEADEMIQEVVSEFDATGTLRWERSPK